MSGTLGHPMKRESLHEILCILIINIALSFELRTFSETSKEILANSALHMSIHSLPCVNHSILHVIHETVCQNIDLTSCGMILLDFIRKCISELDNELSHSRATRTSARCHILHIAHIQLS